MSINVGAFDRSLYTNYSPYRPRDLQAKEDNDRQEKQAISVSEELAASSAQNLNPANNGHEPKPRIVEDAADAEEMRKDNTGSKYSNAQMDMLDIQAAFFGFSSRRTADIQPVELALE